jgi:hypothetical protein
MCSIISMLAVTIKVARKDVPMQQMYLSSHSIPLAISSCSNFFFNYIFTKILLMQILNERLKNEVIWVFSINISVKKNPEIYIHIYNYQITIFAFSK